MRSPRRPAQARARVHSAARAQVVTIQTALPRGDTPGRSDYGPASLATSTTGASSGSIAGRRWGAVLGFGTAESRRSHARATDLLDRSVAARPAGTISIFCCAVNVRYLRCSLNSSPSAERPMLEGAPEAISASASGAGLDRLGALGQLPSTRAWVRAYLLWDASFEHVLRAGPIDSASASAESTGRGG